MAHRTREEVFAWAAAETTAGRKPSYADMAAWGTDYKLDRPLSRSTVTSWARRHGDPREAAEQCVHSTATTPAHTRTHPGDPDEDTPSPSASSALHTPEAIGSRHFSALTPLQERAVILKAAGETHSAIARTLGVHRSTVISWQHLPTFAAALSDLRTEAHIASREALLSGAQEAIHLTIEAMQTMAAVVRSDAVALSPSDQRILEAGELVRPVIDPRLQIQAARVIGQLGRTLLDRGGFHAKAEVQLSGGGSISIDLSGEDLDDLEAGLEDDLAALEVSERRLLLLEGGE